MAVSGEVEVDVMPARLPEPGRASQAPAIPGTRSASLGHRARARIGAMPVDTALGEYLAARRGRVKPEDAGLSDYGRRRVPGLRREELAQPAGVSVHYH